MSSAILYLAIVAIWACVLIPRWLRRDAARPVPLPAPAPDAAGPDAGFPDAGFPDAGFPDMEPAEAEYEDYPPADQDEADVPGPLGAERPPGADGARRRMLAARRRLLLMLAGLEAAAITLAVLQFAAIWVVIPPSVMLVGYLLLLREAAQADAERAQRDADAAAGSRELVRARRAQSRRDTPVEGTSTEGVPEAAAALAAKFAAAPVSEDYEEPGRDFAPGLAGKYTTSNAEAGPSAEAPAGPATPGEPAQDGYADYDQPHLRRAVGDLPRWREQRPRFAKLATVVWGYSAVR